jgi:cytochrome c biogenesis protein CcmG/thiol:disulfide interchange protein DsbE
LARGLNLDPREVPSPLIGKAAPPFNLTYLDDAAHTLSLKDLRGKVWILNVWASWCETCREEHPLLLDFSKKHVVPIYGLVYKADRAAALGTLAMLGNPYDESIFDGNGRVGIDFGVYAVPETFVIDKKGVVRMKQIGALTGDAIAVKIEPLLKKLLAESGS